MKNVYKHKKTGKRVTTSEKLSKKHWEEVVVVRNGQMNSKKIKRK